MTNKNKKKYNTNPGKFSIILRALALTAMWALCNEAALAHHAFALEFDVKKPFDLQGVVSKVELINPHSWIHVDVTDASGQKTRGSCNAAGDRMPGMGHGCGARLDSCDSER